MDVDDASLITPCRIVVSLWLCREDLAIKGDVLHSMPGVATSAAFGNQLWTANCFEEPTIRLSVSRHLSVRAEPQIAPLRGSTVIIHGAGLAAAPDPACKFGREIVKGSARRPRGRGGRRMRRAFPKAAGEYIRQCRRGRFGPGLLAGRPVHLLYR